MAVQPEAVVFGSRAEIDALEGRESSPTDPSDAAGDTEKKSANESGTGNENGGNPASTTDPLGSESELGAGEDPADSYLSGFMKLREAEELEAAGKPLEAFESYKKARAKFASVRERHPLFEPDMVDYRIRRLDSRIKQGPHTFGR